MRVLRDDLDILGVDVLPADDDHVLLAARHVEVVLVEEAQVPCAQEGPFAVLEVRREELCILLNVAPVALGERVGADPDLADAIGRHLHLVVRMDNVHLLRLRVADNAARHELDRVGGVGLDRDDVEVGELRGGEGADHEALEVGHKEGRLGEAVAWPEGVGVEAVLGEALNEARHGRRADGLAPAEEGLDAAQIEVHRVALLVRHLAEEHLKGKVGPTGAPAPGVVDHLKPTEGAFEEGNRAHHVVLCTHEYGVHHGANEAHVMIDRQPGAHCFWGSKCMAERA